MITSKKTHIRRIHHEKLVRPSTTTYSQQQQKNLPSKFSGENHASRPLTKTNQARSFGMQSRASSSENVHCNQTQQTQQQRPVSQQCYPNNVYSSLESSLNTSSTISTNGGGFHNHNNAPNPIQQMFNGARMNGSIKKPETTSNVYNATTGQIFRATSVGDG